MNDLLKQVDQPQDDSTRLIPLTRGQFAIVDAADFEWLNQWKWNAQWIKKSGLFYAQRTVHNSGKRYSIYIHRLILGLTDRSKWGDHKNRNSLDNRRCNIRPCSHSQSNQNKSMRSDNSSGFRGVIRRRENGKWWARIYIDGKQKSLGHFSTAVLAAQAYNRAAVEHFGEFAVLNDI